MAKKKTKKSSRKSKEMVTVKLTMGRRYRLYSKIKQRLKEMDVKKLNDLDLGFDLPDTWPRNGHEVTLAEIIVIAHKLGLEVEIRDVELVTSASDVKNRRKDNDGT